MDEIKIDFKKIEKKWQNEWAKKKIFEVKENSKKKKFYCLEMFPYPSGSGLHMGHAFNYTIGDIFARFKRMQDFNVLYPMGYDALGLPAENAAIKAKSHPKKFIEESVKNFIKQQKDLGLSYDWSRMVATCYPEYYKWNQYLFLQFLKKGLAYRKKASVNWCSKCNTVLANEQVHNGKCWRHEDTDVKIKQLEQWFLKTTDYAEELLEKIDSLKWPERIKIMQKNWIGKSQGINIKFKINEKDWEIFTTRPDTIYGVTFMVISAQHASLMEFVTKEQKKEVERLLRKIKSTSEKDIKELEKEGAFTGSYAINPLTNEKVPVYVGNFVVAEYGSGIVMAVPAHDQRDFDFAMKYDIPIKQVIKPKISKSVVLGKSVEKGFKEELKRNSIEFKSGLSSNKREHIRVILKNNQIDNYIEIIKRFLKENWWVEIIGSKNAFIMNKKVIENFLEDKKLFEECKKHEPLVREYKNMLDMLNENSFYHGFICYTEQGSMINSQQFDGINSNDAIVKISGYIEKKKFGKRTIQYKLKDWLVSRQRYWGTPIPVIYCEKCGVLPVPEKDLPVLLPEKVKFGKGNPLETNKEFVNAVCPNCKGPAKRETDTMDTFFDSSWYFLRYCDSKNKKEPFDKKKAKYWMPVDQYIGGAEHACMHLIYARFFTKALRDLGFLNFDEPFAKLFNQGMLLGEDGNKMAKSNPKYVVLPETVSKKYGIDTARLFLTSLASTDKDILWNEKGIEGSLRLIKKVFGYFYKFKQGQDDKKIESKLNSTIKEVTEYINDFKYNLAIISIRELFESFPEKISKNTAESFLKILHPFCPHITEELWHKLGNKTFLSLEKWPKYDGKKINEKFEEQEKQQEKIISDINNIIRIIKDKGDKVKKVYLYTIPKELNVYHQDEIKKRIQLDVEIFSVADKNKHDPQNKAGKAKPNKPAIYVE